MASAQTCDTDWDCHRIYDGGATDAVMSSVVRAWGPTDEVVLGWERYHPTVGNESSEFYVRAKSCTGSDCSSPGNPYGAADQVGDRILREKRLTPAISIYKEDVDADLEVDVFLRDRWDETGDFCGSTTDTYAALAGVGTLVNGLSALDMSHALWTEGTATGPWLVSGTIVDGDDDCESRASAFIRTRQDTGHASGCWRFNAETPGNYDRIHCGDQTGVGTYSVTALTPQGTTPTTQEHVAYDLDGSDRIAIYKSKESVGGSQTPRIRVRFLDDGGDPSLVLATGANVDFPDFTVSSTGVYHAVWQDGSGNSSTIETALCDPGVDDCTDVANWEYDTIHTGRNLKHPSLTTDGELQLVTYMEDVATGMDPKRFRVRYAFRCGTGTVYKDEVQSPADVEDDQVMFFGHPHIAANRIENVVFVSWVEANEWHDLLDVPTDSEAWWAARTYTDCP